MCSAKLGAMKQFAVPLLFLAVVACSGEKTVVPTETIDARESTGMLYVTAPQADIHAKTDTASELIATYQNGESLPVLGTKGEWTEVRVGNGSGWARSTDLGTAQEKDQAEENPEPKFRVMPMPVTAPGAHGEIYLEADVNTDGDVLSIRTITNTTGSPALASQNTEALRHAKFHPIVIKGARKPFKYYHKVTY
jgi:uncharacterized protein YgiM (DUF1202 family)